MNDLAKIQSEFQAYLIDNKKGAAFNHRIVDDEKVGAEKRLGIYYDAYRLRIIEALATVYPKLKALLGEDLFNKTAREYIDQYPSTYRNLRWYGDKMREHLSRVISQHPVATEMAVFEWALSLAFDAEDVPELALQNLAEIPPENWSNLSFKFQPAMQVIRIQWNVIPIWTALDSEKTPPVPLQNSDYQHWLIWRRDFSSQFRSIDETEVKALNMVMAGESFGDICLSLEGTLSVDEATMLAALYLSDWIESGLIFKVSCI